MVWLWWRGFVHDTLPLQTVVPLLEVRPDETVEMLQYRAQSPPRRHYAARNMLERSLSPSHVARSGHLLSHHITALSAFSDHAHFRSARRIQACNRSHRALPSRIGDIVV